MAGLLLGAPYWDGLCSTASAALGQLLDLCGTSVVPTCQLATPSLPHWPLAEHLPSSRQATATSCLLEPLCVFSSTTGLNLCNEQDTPPPAPPLTRACSTLIRVETKPTSFQHHLTPSQQTLLCNKWHWELNATLKVKTETQILFGSCYNLWLPGLIGLAEEKTGREVADIYMGWYWAVMSSSFLAFTALWNSRNLKFCDLAILTQHLQCRIMSSVAEASILEWLSTYNSLFFS